MAFGCIDSDEHENNRDLIKKLQDDLNHANNKLAHLEAFTGTHIGDDFSFSGHELCDELKEKTSQILVLKQELFKERGFMDNIAFHNTIGGEKYNNFNLAYDGVVRYAQMAISKRKMFFPVTVEQMEKRWPVLPPNMVRKVILLSDNADFDFFEVNQDSIAEVIQYFKSAEEAMNS